MGNVGPLSESLLSRAFPRIELPGPTPPAVVDSGEAEAETETERVTEGAGLDPRYTE